MLPTTGGFPLLQMDASTQTDGNDGTTVTLKKPKPIAVAPTTPEEGDVVVVYEEDPEIVPGAARVLARPRTGILAGLTFYVSSGPPTAHPPQLEVTNPPRPPKRAKWAAGVIKPPPGPEDPEDPEDFRPGDLIESDSDTDDNDHNSGPPTAQKAAQNAYRLSAAVGAAFAEQASISQDTANYAQDLFPEVEEESSESSD